MVIMITSKEDEDKYKERVFLLMLTEIITKFNFLEDEPIDLAKDILKRFEIKGIRK